MARKTSAKESIPPTLSPHRAIELLRRQLEQFDRINALRSDDPAVSKWETTTTGILNGAFGQPNGESHELTKSFSGYYGSMVLGMPDHYYEQEHHKSMLQKKAILESCIEQLELFTPPDATSKLEQRESQNEQSGAQRSRDRLITIFPKQSAGGKVASPMPKFVDVVLFICDRFHLVAQQLRHRRDNRPTLTITNEYDVQDLLHALLRLHFDDVRPEEWTPSYGGGSSRMDFLLKLEQIVVEAKMTRTGLADKEVSEQLIIDAAKYKEHPDCKVLVCLVYDPGSLVKNPRGVERDLARLSGNGLEVICIITP